jgi:hypothetical protein
MKWRVPCLLLLICLLLPAVTAADITLTADRQDYYFRTSAPVEIPLAVESSFPGEMPGTVRFSTDTYLQKTGVVMITTENRVFARTVPAGSSFLNLTIAPSPVPREYKVHISYYYSAPAPVNVSVPELLVHIVAEPGSAGDLLSPVSSTSRPESGAIPSSSSVAVAEQAVGTREQMGSDSTGHGLPSGGQPQGGTAAGRQQNLQEKAQREREQSEFDQRLASDPLFLLVNASLDADGFTLMARDTQPASNMSGTFSLLYRRGAGDQVVVQGSMRDGTVPSVHEAANAEIMADPVLSANTSYQSFRRTLAEGGYRHRETDLDRTLAGVETTVLSTGAGGEKAYVNATTIDGTVNRITLEKDSEGGLFPLMLLPVFFLAAAGTWFLYRKYRGPVTGNWTVEGPVLTIDPRTKAERILKDAEEAFGRQQYPEAYGLAARSLRVYLSHESGDSSEVTATEILAEVSAGGQDTSAIRTLLDRCGDVAYAKGQPDAEDFSALVGRIREIIRE